MNNTVMSMANFENNMRNKTSTSGWDLFCSYNLDMYNEMLLKQYESINTETKISVNKMIHVDPITNKKLLVDIDLKFGKIIPKIVDDSNDGIFQFKMIIGSCEYKCIDAETNKVVYTMTVPENKMSITINSPLHYVSGSNKISNIGDKVWVFDNKKGTNNKYKLVTHLKNGPSSIVELHSEAPNKSLHDFSIEDWFVRAIQNYVSQHVNVFDLVINCNTDDNKLNKTGFFPKAYVFQVAGGRLSVYYQLLFSNHQPGEIRPTFLGNNKLSPIPSSYNMSIIINRKVFAKLMEKTWGSKVEISADQAGQPTLHLYPNISDFNVPHGLFRKGTHFKMSKGTRIKFIENSEPFIMSFINNKIQMSVEKKNAKYDIPFKMTENAFGNWKTHKPKYYTSFKSNKDVNLNATNNKIQISTNFDINNPSVKCDTKYTDVKGFLKYPYVNRSSLQDMFKEVEKYVSAQIVYQSKCAADLNVNIDINTIVSYLLPQTKIVSDTVIGFPEDILIVSKLEKDLPANQYNVAPKTSVKKSNGKKFKAVNHFKLFHGTPKDKKFLSCTKDGKKVDMYKKDDNSGRQKWEIKAVPGLSNQYNILVNHGVKNDRKFLSSNLDGVNVYLSDKDEGTGMQRWEFRKAYKNKDVNIFKVKVAGGVIGKNKLLSSLLDGDRVMLASKDDGSGRQRWDIS